MTRSVARSVGVLGLVLLVGLGALGGVRLHGSPDGVDPSAVALVAASPSTVTATWSSRCGLNTATAQRDTTTRCTVAVGAKRRSYVLSTPATSGRGTLVVAYHGLHQTAATFAGLTGIVPAARAAGVVLAIPESDGPAFNDGRLGPGGPDDDAFFVALVHQLVAAGVADPRRVVVTGFSNGAGMAMSVAAQHPSTVAALVSIAGSLIDAPGAHRPTAPVRTVLVHGTGDTVQPLRGRPAAGPLWPAYIPVLATQAAWVTAAGAGPAKVEREGGTDGQLPVTVTTWAAGRAGKPVTAYTVTGLGHVWPVGGHDTVDATRLLLRVAVGLDPGHAPVGATLALEQAGPLVR